MCMYVYLPQKLHVYTCVYTNKKLHMYKALLKFFCDFGFHKYHQKLLRYDKHW